MSSPQFRKPKQKFQLHFEHDISSQLKEMTPTQLFRLFFISANLLPFSFDDMKKYQSEFSNIIEKIGITLGENIRIQIENSRLIPEIEDLAKSSSNKSLETMFPFVASFLRGLGGKFMDKVLSQNITESIIKLVIPDYNSFTGWRDGLVFYVRTYSRATTTALSRKLPHPSYRQILHFIQKLKPSFNDVRNHEDIITTFDNEQKLKKSYRLGGAEGSNKMETSLCTMVIHLYPAIKSNIQFIISLSPARWLWNRTPDNFSEDESFKKCLKNHKESWWNGILKEVFESSSKEESQTIPVKRKKKEGNEKIANRRKLYDFADSNHTDKPAEIEIGKPYDLNPSSYEGTKQIIRNE